MFGCMYKGRVQCLDEDARAGSCVCVHVDATAYGVSVVCVEYGSQYIGVQVPCNA